MRFLLFSLALLLGLLSSTLLSEDAPPEPARPVPTTTETVQNSVVKNSIVPSDAKSDEPCEHCESSKPVTAADIIGQPWKSILVKNSGTPTPATPPTFQQPISQLISQPSPQPNVATQPANANEGDLYKPPVSLAMVTRNSITPRQALAPLPEIGPIQAPIEHSYESLEEASAYWRDKFERALCYVPGVIVTVNVKDEPVNTRGLPRLSAVSIGVPAAYFEPHGVGQSTEINPAERYALQRQIEQGEIAKIREVVRTLSGNADVNILVSAFHGKPVAATNRSAGVAPAATNLLGATKSMPDPTWLIAVGFLVFVVTFFAIRGGFAPKNGLTRNWGLRSSSNGSSSNNDSNIDIGEGHAA